jgi:predicted rRNA methylase YqxC with S4 and FtsJ domains
MRESPQERALASRAGLKLEAALDAFGVSVENLTAADLGSSAGGFVDVLLRRGATRVYAIEKGFGRLVWSLRNDPRVVVLIWTHPVKSAKSRDAIQVSLFLFFPGCLSSMGVGTAVGAAQRDD